MLNVTNLLRRELKLPLLPSYIHQLIMKNTKPLVIIVLITLVLSGCMLEKNSTDPKIVTFNLKKLPEVSEVKLTELGFSDIEYIPLETTSRSVATYDDLVNRNKFIFGDNVFILKQPKTILEFQTDGKFLTQIGTKGRGPDEFTYAQDININPASQLIYLLSRWQKKFFVYSQKGELVRTFKIDFSPSEFCLIDDKILCYSENHMGNIDNSYTLIDTNGIVLKNFSNKYSFINNNSYMMFGENLFYYFNNKIYKKEVYSDTIFSLESDQFVPHIVIQVGDKLLTAQARTEFDSHYLAENYIIPLNLFEFGNYIYYEFVNITAGEFLIYSFIGSKKSNYNRVIKTQDGIVNDLDGGPNIIPRIVVDDKTIIGIVDPLTLKAHIVSNDFKNSKPKYPEKKNDLMKLADSLSETDNPVLVLVTL
jgi:hypothetical protein